MRNTYKIQLEFLKMEDHLEELCGKILLKCFFEEIVNALIELICLSTETSGGLLSIR
jgi:hypothetical protein